ncbi:MAG: hypothetical protein SOR40_03225 [Rothia sp. (in: high G+C Gram-positive bacteria)]|nr:hypothetical protein [Rothia sp. (in: high G+C Gram-positive bacteria)]
MSENLDSPVEEVGPEVYRRRRIVALLLLVFVLLLIIGLVNMLAGGKKDQTAGSVATSSASSSSAAFSDFTQRATESAQASESASPSAEASQSAEEQASQSATASTEASESASPEASQSASESASASPEPTPSSSALLACSASDIQVSLTSDRSSYAAGQTPALAVTYTNVSGQPCLVTGGLNNVDVNIISGPAQVYNYAQCYANPLEDAQIAAGATNTTALTWDRSLNVLGCGTSATIQPGYYWATASVNGVTSQPLRIIVTG